MPIHESEAHKHALEKEQCRRAKDWHRNWIVGGSAADIQAEAPKAESLQPIVSRAGHAGLGPSPKWVTSPGPTPRSSVGLLATGSNLRTVGGLVALQIGEPKPRNTSKSLRIRMSAPNAEDHYPTKMAELKSNRTNLGFCFNSPESVSQRPSPRIFDVSDAPAPVPFMPSPVEHFGRRHHLTHTRDAYRSSGAFGACVE